MSASPTLDDVVECLTNVVPVESTTSTTTWSAGTLGLPGGGVFGGQLLGQIISIAAALDPGMPVKSVTAAFPRTVRDTGTLQFDVSCLHRGSAYATQRVDIAQPDRAGQPAIACTSTVISHHPADGIAHQLPPPPNAGSPDAASPADLGIVPWECRIVGGTDLNERGAQRNELLLWTRVDQRLGKESRVHQALLAYLTDLTLIGTALLGHEGWSQLDAHRTLRTSVVAHQVWFHRPFCIDDWLLLSQSSPVAADGSALGFGHVHTMHGDLVASFAQESMIRFPTEAEAAR